MQRRGHRGAVQREVKEKQSRHPKCQNDLIVLFRSSGQVGKNTVYQLHAELRPQGKVTFSLHVVNMGVPRRHHRLVLPLQL